jgi:hypothetical protein
MAFGSCQQLLQPISNLAVESGEVVECLDTRKEEIPAAFYGREGGQTLYLSSDRPLRNSYVVAAVLSTDHRIASPAVPVNSQLAICPPSVGPSHRAASST